MVSIEKNAHFSSNFAFTRLTICRNAPYISERAGLLSSYCLSSTLTLTSSLDSY